MIYKSPIKLNLFLHVLGQRADGYHNLETIYQLIDYYDEIEIKTNTSGQINRVYGNENINYDDDLLIKAAKIILPFNNTALGVDIGIKKKAPIGGGVGGGSSNAATVLLALNQLWQANLSNKELQKLGRKLGADVPVFIFGKNAFASGVGEILTAVELPKYYFLVLSPDVSISTRDIFMHKALTKSTKLGKIPTFLAAINLGNDCLKPALLSSSLVRTSFDLLAKIKTQITSAKLSGTGACVFSIFKTKEQAKLALDAIQPELDRKHIKGFVAKGL